MLSCPRFDRRSKASLRRLKAAEEIFNNFRPPFVDVYDKMSRANFYEGAVISIQIGWHILFSLKMCLQLGGGGCEFFFSQHSRVCNTQS